MIGTRAARWGTVAVLTVAAAGAGWLAGPVMARSNRTVKLAAAAYAEDRTVLAEEPRLTADRIEQLRRNDELYAEAHDVVGSFRVGGALFWGFSVALVSLGLFTPRRPSRPRIYEPDQAYCLACARCFSYCPEGGAEIREEWGYVRGDTPVLPVVAGAHDEQGAGRG